MCARTRSNHLVICANVRQQEGDPFGASLVFVGMVKACAPHGPGGLLHFKALQQGIKRVMNPHVAYVLLTPEFFT